MVDEKLLYKALGKRLKSLRESQQSARGRITQADLAQDVGLERTSITNIERGNQKVSLHVLYRICNALQVPISEVLPPLSDLKSGPPASELEELKFAGRTEQLPPRLKQRLALLIGDDSHERET